MDNMLNSSDPLLIATLATGISALVITIIVLIVQIRKHSLSKPLNT